MALAYKHLVKRPNGNVEIAGWGIRVYTILTCHELGEKAEEIADGYEIPLGAVYEALAYAANNPEEMEAIRQRDAAVTREILSRLPPELTRGLDIP